MTLTGLLAGCGLVLLAAGTAAAEATDPPNATGGCSAFAIVEGGERIDPYESSGVYEIPLAGTAEYEGQVGDGEDRPERAFDGEVVIKTPPLLPDVELTDEWTWDGPGTGAFAKGDVTWDLPAGLPRGVPFKVEGYHQDDPERCEGYVRVTIEGGLFDSPVAPAALGGTALSLLGIGVAGIKRGVA
jgi:hypothetical protein